MSGIYLRVFTPVSFRSLDLQLFCPVGSSLLRLTMNGELFGAVFPAGTLFGSVTIGASPDSRVDLFIQ